VRGEDREERKEKARKGRREKRWKGKRGKGRGEDTPYVALNFLQNSLAYDLKSTLKL